MDLMFCLAAFLATFWLAVFFHARITHAIRWPTLLALTIAAATQMITLVVLASSSPALVSAWSRWILWITPLYLSLCTFLGFAVLGRPWSKSSPRERALLIGPCCFAAFVMVFTGLGGGKLLDAPELSGELNFIGVLLVIGAILGYPRSSYVQGRYSTVLHSRAALIGLSSLVLIPLLISLPPLLASISRVLIVLPWAGAVAYGLLRLPRVRLDRMREQLSPFIGAAFLLSFYSALSAFVFWVLLRMPQLQHPMPVAVALSVVIIGGIELLRQAAGTTWLNQRVQLPYRSFYMITRTLQRALTGSELTTLAQRVLEELCSRLSIDQGFIAFRNSAEQPVFTIQASFGPKSLPLGGEIALPLSSEPFQVHDSESTLPAGLAEMEVLVPILASGVQIGALVLGSPPNGLFDGAEIELLTGLGDQLSAAWTNMRLKGQLIARLDEMAAHGETILGQQALVHESLRSGLAGLETDRRERLERVRVNCLGSFEVWIGHRSMADDEWGTRSSGHRHGKAIFAYLLANRTRTVARDELIEVVWGESAHLAVLQSRLDRTISALRRAIEPALDRGTESVYILTTMGGYRLNPSIEWEIDAEEFVRLAQQATELSTTDHRGALHLCQQAEALYRGDYMIGCPFIERSHLIVATRESLRSMYLQTLVMLGRLHQRLGASDAGIEALQRAALEDEYNEQIYQELIAAYLVVHRHAEAALVCKTHESILERADLPCGHMCLDQ